MLRASGALTLPTDRFTLNAASSKGFYLDSEGCVATENVVAPNMLLVDRVLLVQQRLPVLLLLALLLLPVVLDTPVHQQSHSVEAVAVLAHLGDAEIADIFTQLSLRQSYPR